MTAWVDLEDIMLSEISQTEKDRYCMISLVCGIEKTRQTKQNENRLIDTENKWLPEGRGVEG